MSSEWSSYLFGGIAAGTAYFGDLLSYKVESHHEQGFELRRTGVDYLKTQGRADFRHENDNLVEVASRNCLKRLISAG